MTTLGIALLLLPVLKWFWDLVANYEVYRAGLAAVDRDPNAPPPIFR